MNFPLKGDFLDIHNHGGSPEEGIFSVENLMAHEVNTPDLNKGITYTYGIHPWHLDDSTFTEQIEKVRIHATHENVCALGEAGYDKLRGPSREIQSQAFEEQIRIAERNSKPLYIHCVRSWEDLIATHKKMNPSMPWLIHGFRGKKELAFQLISRGMYISFWYEFIIRPESGELVRSIPSDRIFLESDGSGVDIRTIYKKVSDDLGINPDQLKQQIHSNFKAFFGLTD